MRKLLPVLCCLFFAFPQGCSWFGEEPPAIPAPVPQVMDIGRLFEEALPDQGMSGKEAAALARALDGRTYTVAIRDLRDRPVDVPVTLSFISGARSSLLEFVADRAVAGVSVQHLIDSVRANPRLVLTRLGAFTTARGVYDCYGLKKGSGPEVMLFFRAVKGKQRKAKKQIAVQISFDYSYPPTLAGFRKMEKDYLALHGPGKQAGGSSGA